MERQDENGPMCGTSTTPPDFTVTIKMTSLCLLNTCIRCNTLDHEGGVNEGSRTSRHHQQHYSFIGGIVGHIRMNIILYAFTQFPGEGQVNIKMIL